MGKLLVWLSILVTGPMAVKASNYRKIATVGASAVAVYPILKTAYQWDLYRRNRVEVFSEMDDVVPVVEQVTRNYLRKQAYVNADTVALKVFGDGSMEAIYDGGICFSAGYVNKIEAALMTPELLEASGEKVEDVLSDFRFTLNHEMLHIQEEHAKKSIAAQVWIPGLVEAAVLTIVCKLIKTKNPYVFAAGLLVSVPVKWGIFSTLQMLHRREQEYDAEMSAIQKADVTELKARINYCLGIVEQGLVGSIPKSYNAEQSSWWAIPISMKILGIKRPEFDRERASMDQDYAVQQMKLIREVSSNMLSRPYMWPIRALQLEADPQHPFLLDMVEKMEDRVKELEGSKA